MHYVTGLTTTVFQIPVTYRTDLLTLQRSESNTHPFGFSHYDENLHNTLDIRDLARHVIQDSDRDSKILSATNPLGCTGSMPERQATLWRTPQARRNS